MKATPVRLCELISNITIFVAPSLGIAKNEIDVCFTNNTTEGGMFVKQTSPKKSATLALATKNELPT